MIFFQNLLQIQTQRYRFNIVRMSFINILLQIPSTSAIEPPNPTPNTLTRIPNGSINAQFNLLHGAFWHRELVSLNQNVTCPLQHVQVGDFDVQRYFGVMCVASESGPCCAKRSSVQGMRQLKRKLSACSVEWDRGERILECGSVSTGPLKWFHSRLPSAKKWFRWSTKDFLLKQTADSDPAL